MSDAVHAGAGADISGHASGSAGGNARDPVSGEERRRATPGAANGGTIDYAAYRAERHFTALDGLRAISVLLVVLAHARGREEWLWIRGANGVTVFFVLSGYLITTLALREEAVRGRIDLGAFYLRRTFRILPMYYLTLAIYCVLVLVLHADPDRHDKFVRALPYYLAYFQEWPHLVLKSVPFELSWSLGIEEKFYLVWPVLGFILFRKHFRLRLGSALALAAACTLAACLASWGRFVLFYAHILIGCALAILLDDPRVYARLRALARPVPAVALVVLAIAAHFTTDAIHPWTHVLFAATVALALIGFVAGSSPVTRALTWRPLVWLGGISYGVYLFNQLGLHVAMRVVPARWGLAGDGLAMLLGLAITLVVCEGLHRRLELPLIRYGRTLAARRKSAQGKPA
jgi:peptidoglycan/LPS O-acetylase OafA/YrhL